MPPQHNLETTWRQRDNMEESHRLIRKYSRFIPIKKWRHDFRETLINTLHTQKGAILQDYAKLVTPTNDRETQKQILKRNVRLVEIEIASFCNRKCWFCPNSFVDRYSSSIELPEHVYLKIIDNLAEIDYSGMINFHRFNEPLANKELILKRVKQARKSLPKALLGIFTNGDYLDRDYLDSLREVGIGHITMSYYFGKNIEFDVENVIKPAINKMANKLNLQYKEVVNDDRQYGVRFIYDGMDMIYRAWNPRVNASNRAGSINDECIPSVKRDFPCYYPLREIFIDYNGLVMPCCNMRSDVETHKQFVLGDIAEVDLFELFMNEKFIKIRKALMSNTPQYEVCKYCDYKINL